MIEEMRNRMVELQELVMTETDEEKQDLYLSQIEEMTEQLEELGYEVIWDLDVDTDVETLVIRKVF